MNQERILNILLQSHLSEKTAQTSNGYRQYAFKVAKDAAKPEIRRAVEQLFQVHVRSVRVSNVKSKAKRFGRVEGRTKGWKKAYVTLEQGQELDVTRSKPAE